MTPTMWSACLQWQRMGMGALVFVCAARFLTLGELGAFAAAYAPVRLFQMVQRGALIDGALVSSQSAGARAAAWVISICLGILGGILCILAGLFFTVPNPELLFGLAPIPIATALGALPEARLRRALHLRALALRTGFATGLAAALTFCVLKLGFGALALVCFATSSSLLSNGAAMWLVPSLPRLRPKGRDVKRMLRIARPIAIRDLISAGPLPILHVVIGLFVGLPAAGAFQLAARMSAVLDGLFVAPFRYIALPLFVNNHHTSEAFYVLLRVAALVAGILFPAVYVAAPVLLPVLIGVSHSLALLPLVGAFCVSGAVSAMAMPFVQWATAQGRADLPLMRAVLMAVLAGLGTALTLEGGVVSLVWSFATASALSAVWFMLRVGIVFVKPGSKILRAILPGLALAGAILWQPYFSAFAILITGGVWAANAKHRSWL